MKSIPSAGDYTDIELRVLRRGERGSFPVEITVAGRAEFDGGELAGDIVERLQAVRRPEEKGALLFSQLLADQRLRRAWDQVEGAHPRRRLRLRLDDGEPALHALPWEALGSGAPLAADDDTPFSRYLACEHEQGAVIEERPLRLLAVISNPSDLASYGCIALDENAERNALAEAVAPAAAQGEIELRVLIAPVTLARLEQQLVEWRPHLLHVVAHGKFNPLPDLSVIYLANEQGTTAAIDEAALADLVRRQGASLRLVYLSSCESARRDAGDALRGFAPRLVQAGVAAVLAMQGKVGIATGRELAATFYRQLLAHGLVDLAANEARSRLLAAALPGATLPVLFLRQRDGALLAPRVLRQDGSNALLLSFAPGDAAQAADLAARLAARGYTTVSVPAAQAPSRTANRERELHQLLLGCRAVLLLASERWPVAGSSPPELVLARAAGKPVLALCLTADADLDSLGELVATIDLAADPEEGLAELAAKLFAAGIDAAPQARWDDARSPYPGLLAFEQEDEPVFFGREREIGAGLDHLHRMRRFGSCRLLLLLGASGSGKSSLLKAGLLPRLERDHQRWLVVPSFRPGDDPLLALADALARASTAAGRPRSWREVHALLSPAGSDAGPAAALARLIEELRLDSGRREATVLLAVDQLEEAFVGSAASMPREAAFLELLRGVLLLPDLPLLVLATLRSDFLGTFQQAPALMPHAGAGPPFEALPVGPLDLAGLNAAIAEPARAAGLRLERGLIQAILADLGTEDALPLLAFALRELYERGGGDGLLEIRDYEEGLGGLAGAVARVADGLLAARHLGDREEQDLRRALLALVRLDGEGHCMRQTARKNELPEPVRPLLEDFVKARLLLAGGTGDEATLEVTHEAVFRSWDRLAAWLRDGQQALRLRRELDEAADQWQRAGRDKEYVWNKKRLKSAQELAADLLLEPQTLAFLEASRKAQKRRLFWPRLAMAAGGLVLLGGLALVGVFRYIVLTVAGLANAEIAWSSDGRRLATGSLPGPVRLWDLQKQDAARLLGRKDGLFRAVAFSPDGRSLASVDMMNEAELWDLGSNQAERLPTQDTLLSSVAFSPDGKTLVGAGPEGLLAWNMETRTVIWDDPRDDFSLYRKIAFQPDGGALVSGEKSGHLVFRDPTTGKERHDLRGHSHDVHSLAFSPDGHRLASAGLERTARAAEMQRALKIIDLDTGSQQEVDLALAAGFAWSPDGRTIAFANYYELVLLDLASHQQTKLAHPTSLQAVRYHPTDLNRLATLDDHGCVELWDLAQGRAVTRLEPGCTERDLFTRLIAWIID